MGVINLTPDSFSGDGLSGDPVAALRRAEQMVEEGADVLDIGGESTRPGFTVVESSEQINRVIPAIRLIKEKLDIPISIDTTDPAVARAALDVGADFVNDTAGLLGHQNILEAVCSAGAAVVAMHNQRGKAHHGVLEDIRGGWAKAVKAAELAGLPRHRIIVDPGFGFGWSHVENLEILRGLAELRAFNLPILIGPSRKSCIGAVLDLPVDQRLEGTAATVAVAVFNGSDVIRVHDVEPMVRVARMADAVVRGWQPPVTTNA